MVACTCPPDMHGVDIRFLQQARLFRRLDEATLAELAATAQCQVYPRDMLVSETKVILDATLVVVRGRLRAYRLSREGRVVTLNILHAGDILMLTAFDPGPNPHTFAQVIEDSTMLYNPTETIEAFSWRAAEHIAHNFNALAV